MKRVWRDCIVTYIDVTDIKSLAKRGTSEASRLMRDLHSLAQTSMNQMPRHKNCYCWNDSVILVADWNKEIASGKAILAEISVLKRRIDTEIHKSYAVSVKGQAFPDDNTPSSPNHDKDCRNPRCVVLKTSSYAMANCFEIEGEAKRRKLRASWYVDSWLKKALCKPPCATFSVKMLPRDTERDVFIFDGYLPDNS